jgi:hypothetical protein
MVKSVETPPDLQCDCGHGFSAHEHYRRGTDCALCAPGECLRFSAVTREPARNETPAVSSEQ